MNTRSTYSYRDAGNYKFEGHAIVTGMVSIAQAEALRAVAFHEDGEDYFVPESMAWVRASPYPWDDAIDHPYHKIESIEMTGDPATDTRSISAIIEAFRAMDWDEEATRHSGDPSSSNTLNAMQTHPYGIAATAIMA